MIRFCAARTLLAGPLLAVPVIAALAAGPLTAAEGAAGAAPRAASAVAAGSVPGTAAGAAAGAAAATPAELSRIFPLEADVAADAAGPARLVLPAEVVAACRPDLSDLRVFAADGTEVPFLVDAGLAPERTLEVIRRVAPKVTDASRREIHRDTGPPLRRESFDLGLPEKAPARGAWDLIADIAASEFVARVSVDGLGAAGATTPLVADGSLFRLRGPRPAEKMRLPLPAFDGRRLRVTLESESPTWLEPSFRLENARALEHGGRIAVPLEVLSSRSDGGRTICEVQRPRGIVPDLLRIETATGTYDRQVEVWDEGPGSAGAALGSGRVFRVEALVPVGEQEIALSAAHGDRLRIEILDGDSPALVRPAFQAVIRQPSLILPLPPAPGGGAAAVLRFGGGRAHPPRYDLAGLLPAADQAATGRRAEAAALLLDTASLHPARLGERRPNPAYDGTPALAFAMHPGAALDTGLFSHRREIAVPTSPEGLSRLRLAPEDLAVLRDDLSDLRVVDTSSRQWPYLVEPAATTVLVPLAPEAPERRDHTSLYPLRLPVSPLRFDRLLLDSDAGFFDRLYRLEGEAAGRPATLAHGRLRRPVGDPRAVSIDVTPARVTALRLEVEDGDDAPLAFQAVQTRVLLPEVYLAAPAGRYVLLLGAPDESAPRYELEHARDVVLAVRAAAVEMGALEANPDRSLAARFRARGLRQTVLLWAVLVLAVAVLTGLTLRLARRAPSPPGA